MHTQETMQQRPHRTRDLQRHVHIPHASIVSVWTFIPNVGITCPETTTVTAPPPKEEKRKPAKRSGFQSGGDCDMLGPYRMFPPFRFQSGQKWKVTILVGAIFHVQKAQRELFSLLALTKIDRLDELVYPLAAKFDCKIFLTEMVCFLLVVFDFLRSFFPTGP